MGSCVAYLLTIGIEFLSSSKQRLPRQALKWSQVFLLVFGDIVSELCGLPRSRVQCSVCGWVGRKFFHFYPGSGGTIRDDAICPKCRSLERQRAMAEVLLGMNVGRERRARILNVAPHPALLGLFSRLPDVRVVTIDLESPLAMIRMDLHELGFRDASFDLVICSHVLEHVRDDILCMRELRRVLKPGQVAFLPVPLNRALDATIEYGAPDPDQHGHVREYGRDYFSRLGEAGFQLLVQGDVMAVRRSL